jgi:glucoamylase
MVRRDAGQGRGALECGLWRTVRDAVTHDTTLGVHVADLSTTRLRRGDRVDFTFYWPEVDRWEGTDFVVCVE